MEEKINMSVEEVFDIAFPSDFGNCDGTIFSLPTFPQGYERIGYTFGASKFVIFLNDDVVAKIPFDGEIYEWEDDEKDYYLEPFSIDDYCELELEVYKDAVKRGIDVFFAKIERVGFSKIGHRPIYIAERVIPRTYDHDTDVHPSKDSIERAKKAVDDCYLPENWLAEAYEYYGAELTDKLIDFLKEKDIRDLHNDNIGYRKDNSPVILDYSDFLE